MNTIADLCFEYIWLMIFGTEDQIDQDYSVKMQESLFLYLLEMTDDEKQAMSNAAKRMKASMGTGDLSEEQLVMLNAFIEQDVYEQH